MPGGIPFVYKASMVLYLFFTVLVLAPKLTTGTISLVLISLTLT